MPATSGNHSENVGGRPPPWGFVKGVAVGAVVGLPLCALTVWLFARWWVDGDATYPAHVRLCALYAGIPWLATAGGIGRLAAHASASGPGGRWRGIVRAIPASAAAAGATVLVGAIAAGAVPEYGRAGFVGLIAAGAITGVPIGLIIGAVVSGPTPSPLPMAWQLAKWPTEAVTEVVRDLLLEPAVPGQPRRRRATLPFLRRPNADDADHGAADGSGAGTTGSGTTSSGTEQASDQRSAAPPTERSERSERSESSNTPGSSQPGQAHSNSDGGHEPGGENPTARPKD